MCDFCCVFCNPCLLFFFTFIKKKIQQVLHIDFLMDCFHKAAEKLAQDFGLIYDSQAPPRRRYVRQKTEAQKFREDRQRCYRVLSDYYYL